MNVSIVVCTYNRAESLRITLRSLAAMRVPPSLEWEVLVVDNNCNDHTRPVVEAAVAQLPCHYLFEPRQGKSFALNAAILRARGEVIAFTDDDATVHPDWLVALWRAFTHHRCVGVGGRIHAVWSLPQPPWYGESGPYRLMPGVIVRYDYGDVAREIETPPFGANMAFRREAFAKYGLFKTTLGPIGTRLALGEDTEFGRRVHQGGESIVYAPEAIVYHPVDAGRIRKQYFQSWYYRYGQAEVRLKPPPATRRWFGVPRYLVRELAGEAVAWLTTFNPKARFFHKLGCYQCLGGIAECLRPAPRD